MDYHIREFYALHSEETPRGHFHKVIVLHESPDIDWKSIAKQVPELPRGWFELARLANKDRIEFSRDFWISKLPYRQGLSEFLIKFFDSLDDIGVFITQKKFDDPYKAELVYSFKDNSGFFRGKIPADEKELDNLNKFFKTYILPADFLAFLQIHNGFTKTTDCTGILQTTGMPGIYQEFQQQIEQSDQPILTKSGKAVNPKTLIPFYKSFGMPFYQCFWGEWYPEQEMGNVYYSADQMTISNVEDGEPSINNMAFPTFADWLMFYLEKID